LKAKFIHQHSYCISSFERSHGHTLANGDSTVPTLKTNFKQFWGAPFVKILYLTDLAQKMLPLRIFSFRYLCAYSAISAQR